MASYLAAIRLSESARKRKRTKFGLVDVIFGPEYLSGKPASTYYLVRSKDGRPLNTTALASKSRHVKVNAENEQLPQKDIDKKADTGHKESKHKSKHKSKSQPAGDAKKADSKPAAEEKKKDEPKEKDKPSPAAPDDDADKDAHVFTAEQDAKLTEMKTGNKTWKEIEEALNKPKFALQARWKEIKPSEEGAVGNDAAGGGGKGGDAAKDKATAGKQGGAENAQKHAKDQDNVAKAEAEKNKQQGKQANNENQGGKRGKKNKHQNQTLLDMMPNGVPTPPASVHSVRSSRSYRGRAEPKLSLSALTALLAEDAEFFTAAEIRDLWKLLTDDEEDQWLRVASRFFDATGRRVHEDDIKAKVKALLAKV
ncbi:hypothetical protein C1H76_3857 [Elsinoe australis]|uniref:Myb-like domain-containing protein n=1 Tax=Elsinoe australis TaxID=40998 RepID=A0A4U7AZR3_9PEZI|nr:hypothetical protein C1H76_3857 [Elsinoe australis]